MAEQTLDVRGQTLEEEVFQKLQKDQTLQKHQKDQKDQMPQKNQKLNGVQWPSTKESHIIPRSRARVCAHYRSFVFLLSQVSHNPYNSLSNNYLHRQQKQHSKNITLSHCYSTQKTPQNTILNPTFQPQIPKQHVVFHKTTRNFPQNDTSLSIKPHVVFEVMMYFQPHPL